MVGSLGDSKADVKVVQMDVKLADCSVASMVERLADHLVSL